MWPLIPVLEELLLISLIYALSAAPRSTADGLSLQSPGDRYNHLSARGYQLNAFHHPHVQYIVSALVSRLDDISFSQSQQKIGSENCGESRKNLGFDK